jgi:hypothetical protein
MFPDWWWVPGMILAVICIGVPAVLIDELIHFIIRHWHDITHFVQHLV